MLLGQIRTKALEPELVVVELEVSMNTNLRVKSRRDASVPRVGPRALHGEGRGTRG